jgi:hypothetical protein
MMIQRVKWGTHPIDFFLGHMSAALCVEPTSEEFASPLLDV